MSEKKKTFTIAIGSGQYTKERPYTMLRFAYTALLEEHKNSLISAVREIISGLTDKELEDLSDSLRKLQDILSKIQ